MDIENDKDKKEFFKFYSDEFFPIYSKLSANAELSQKTLEEISAAFSLIADYEFYKSKPVTECFALKINAYEYGISCLKLASAHMLKYIVIPKITLAKQYLKPIYSKYSNKSNKAPKEAKELIKLYPIIKKYLTNEEHLLKELESKTKKDNKEETDYIEINKLIEKRYKNILHLNKSCNIFINSYYYNPESKYLFKFPRLLKRFKQKLNNHTKIECIIGTIGGLIISFIFHYYSTR